jgi:hypothetical protein
MADLRDDRIYANGVDGLTGRYLIEPISTAELAAWGRRPDEDVRTSQWIRLAWENAAQDQRGRHHRRARRAGAAAPAPRAAGGQAVQDP